jgi:hypothetical protein
LVRGGHGVGTAVELGGRAGQVPLNASEVNGVGRQRALGAAGVGDQWLGRYPKRVRGGGTGRPCKGSGGGAGRARTSVGIGHWCIEVSRESEPGAWAVGDCHTK